MCGRFTLSATPLEIAERFNVPLSFFELYEKSYNVSPSHHILSVINSGLERRAGLLRWGLIPSWSKDEKIGYKMINARAETIDEKPSFKHAFMKRRCLIIADGFYEWKRQSGTKQPMRITLRNQQLFAMAGLWEKWQAPDGNSIYSCTVITTKPNELVADIHDRMPVILRKQDEQLWLNRNIEDVKLLKDVLQPYNTNDMEAYPVSSLVNTPKNNSIELIAPLC
ncbi:SOS response-associated peptidase [Bacillaceae bacterium IKA-2]|nr:SOS response-associated peptidase [Bacillaceae bacterium IKA-2]